MQNLNLLSLRDKVWMITQRYFWTIFELALVSIRDFHIDFNPPDITEICYIVLLEDLFPQLNHLLNWTENTKRANIVHIAI